MFQMDGLMGISICSGSFTLLEKAIGKEALLLLDVAVYKTAVLGDRLSGIPKSGPVQLIILYWYKESWSWAGTVVQ